jgi:hypothetical protein
MLMKFHIRIAFNAIDIEITLSLLFSGVIIMEAIGLDMLETSFFYNLKGSKLKFPNKILHLSLPVSFLSKFYK